MSTPSPQTLYFAYGSNLSLSQMQTRCPDSTCVGIGVLQDYRWIVNQRGYANIIFCGGSESVSKSESESDSDSESGEDINDGKDAKNANETRNTRASKNPSTSPRRRTQETTTKLLSTRPRNPQNTVYGLLYTLSHRDETLLDTSEGVPFAYTKISPLITLLSISPSLATPTIAYLLSLFPGSISISVSGVSSAGLAMPSLPPSLPLSSPPTASQPSQPSPPLQIRALTYIDALRIIPSAPNPEYITRMNRGIRDALAKGFPPSYVRDVMRLYIPASEEGDGF
ncbi:uncharacterized protein Bfra_006474 [Botrytis fragariae]|uniref:gamma-glutamylcyclotransferase n=1 Tax=Botrytis fragariae TaxID=1964551 RepID=A0A8H6B4Z6_9HELO|nr:uncharacterized protein Bfra_006474 [Botrytis fragariae]KAF5879268.1 hypothetical protein Bfra_006474 [Botrytis fragariae]